jgi:hypothetical protein
LITQIEMSGKRIRGRNGVDIGGFAPTIHPSAAWSGILFAVGEGGAAAAHIASS